MSPPDPDQHPELPVDPDVASARTRAPHLTPRLLALVALGGAVGTGVRYAVAESLPAYGGWPWPTWSVNLLGAFLLGWLLEGLARRGPDLGRRRLLRLLLGTGFCGGFTTYSTFAVEIDQLLGSSVITGLAYALGTLVVGFAASWLGVWLGAHRRRAQA